MMLQLIGHLADGLLIVILLLTLVLGVRAPGTALLFRRYRAVGLAAERQNLTRPLPADSALPAVLVQIPTYNEGELVRRILGAVAAFDWPRDRLQIQLLDDSSGPSAEIASDAAAGFRRGGHDVVLLQRTDRAGFKAGALKEGLACSTQPFVAIFDADYIPEPDFLRLCLRPLIADPSLAFVQARCDFLNPDENRLTRAQQSALGAHFGVEQPARSWAGQFLPFNGTCGVWRRAAIEDAGGWQGDTLTEDIDLSYRAFLAGWRAMYLATVSVPGELPSDMTSWGMQQRRWNKGYAQTARKILPRVMASRLPWQRKLDAVLLLGGCVLGPLMLLQAGLWVIDWLIGTFSFRIVGTLAVLGLLQGVGGILALTLLTPAPLADQRGPGRRRLGTACMIGLLAMWMQFRAALLTTRDVIEGLFGRSSAFVRTPKRSGAVRQPTVASDDRALMASLPPQRLESIPD
jgi:cellulose synthase/poly-beta-1,6-N-acetylglucosamine synthase-like glycosyltransferase